MLAGPLLPPAQWRQRRRPPRQWPRNAPGRRSMYCKSMWIHMHYTGIDVFQVQVTKIQAIHLNFFFALTNNQSALYLSTGNWPWCSVDMYILVVGWKWVADMEEKREMDGDRKGGGGTTRRTYNCTCNTGVRRGESGGDGCTCGSLGVRVHGECQQNWPRGH